MDQPSLFHMIFDAVLADVDTETLTDDERSALKSVFGTLHSALSAVTAGSSTQDSMDHTVSINDLLDWGESTEIDTPLAEQSDIALIALLAQHIEAASCVVEVLQQRLTAPHSLEPLRQLELQLVATAINIDVLQQNQTEVARPVLSVRSRLIRLLLHEFDFINRWLRKGVVS